MIKIHEAKAADVNVWFANFLESVYTQEEYDSLTAEEYQGIQGVFYAGWLACFRSFQCNAGMGTIKTWEDAIEKQMDEFKGELNE